MSLIESVPPVVRSPICAVLLYWLAAALGRRLCRLAKLTLSAGTPPERGLLYAAIGTGALQFLPFGLGAAQLLSPTAIRVGLLALAALLSPDLLAVARAARRELRALELASLSPGWKAWGLLLGAVLLLLVVHALAPGRLADDDGYHLTAPKRWLEAGGLVYLPSYGHTNSPMGFEMLYALALPLGDVSTAKMVHYGAGCLTMAALALGGKRLAGGVTGVYAITLIILPNRLYDFTFLFNQAYIELGTCFMVAASVLALSIWHRDGDEGALWLSALCAGFAASFKFPALTIGLGLTLAVFVSLRARGEPLGRQLKLPVIVGALAAVPVLPWLGRNFWLTGNPVYPMFPGLLPSRDWTPELGREFTRYFRYYNWAQNSFRGISEPHRKLMLLIAALLLLGIAVFAYLRAKDLLVRALVVFTTVPLLAWLAVVGLYFRFWLPVIIVVWLMVAAVLSKFASGRRWAALPAIAGLSIWLVSWLHFLAKDTTGFMADLRIGLGLSTPAQEFKDDELWQTFSYLNRETPKSSQVLFAAFSSTFGPTSAGGAYWVDRPCYATDARLQGYIRSESYDQYAADIEKAGIDYVVMSATEPPPDTDVLRTGSAREYVMAQRLVERRGRELRRFGDVLVYQLARP